MILTYSPLANWYQYYDIKMMTTEVREDAMTRLEKKRTKEKSCE
jgi:hypothetical protein